MSSKVVMTERQSVLCVYYTFEVDGCVYELASDDDGLTLRDSGGEVVNDDDILNAINKFREDHNV
jgi:hypothetical protein